MKPSIALEQNRRAVCEATRRFRATNPRIFGSVLHGDDQDGSDLDVLVEIPYRAPPYSILAASKSNSKNCWGCQSIC